MSRKWSLPSLLRKFSAVHTSRSCLHVHVSQPPDENTNFVENTLLLLASMQFVRSSACFSSYTFNCGYKMTFIACLFIHCLHSKFFSIHQFGEHLFCFTLHFIRSPFPEKICISFSCFHCSHFCAGPKHSFRLFCCCRANSRKLRRKTRKIIITKHMDAMRRETYGFLHRYAQLRVSILVLFHMRFI